jgi:PelA/Pel-15E family pectate lyase
MTAAMCALGIGCLRSAATAAPAAAPPAASSQPPLGVSKLVDQPDEWFRIDEARRVVDNIVTWQNANGGWWKAYDLRQPRPAQPAPGADKKDVPPADANNVWQNTSTFDNGATYSELRILARAHRVTGEPKYKQSFDRGLKFVSDAQYPNGGWPQRFPLEDNYGRHVTFNDNAMTSVMAVLRDVAAGKPDFAFVSEDDRKRAKESFDRGVECILACQIKVNGKPTVWCQQHDAETLAPTRARAYELPSLCSAESADIVMLLMRLDQPDARVRGAIDAAANWFERSKITGKRFETVTGPQYEEGKDKVLVDDPFAPPLWARFYDIETNKPFFVGRDGVPRASVDQISHERRKNYAWFNTSGTKVAKAYAEWKKRNGVAESAAAAR